MLWLRLGRVKKRKSSMVLTFSRLFSVEQPSIAEENEQQRTQRGGAATQTRPRNASHKEAQKAQKGIPFVALVPFCGQENLVGLKRFGGIAMQRWNRQHFLVFLCASVVHLIMIETVATIPRLSVS